MTVVVDHTPLLEKQEPFQAEKLGRFVREDVTAALQESHGIEIVDATSEATLIVTLAWVNYHESIYRFDVAIRREGRDVEPVDTWEIEYMNSSQLTGSVVERLPAVLEHLQRSSEAPSEDPLPPDPASPESLPPIDDAPPAEPQEKAAVLGPVGIAGIVAGGGGLVLGAVSLGFALRDPTSEVDGGGEQQTLGRRPWAGTYGWTAVGFGLAAAGVTMLAVDLTVLRRRRAQALSMSPLWGPSTAGLQLTTQF